jgi:hypothetical protein
LPLKHVEGFEFIQTVEVTVKFTPEQATKAQTGVDVQLYPFFNLGARWGGWSTPRLGRFIPGNDPVPIV